MSILVCPKCGSKKVGVTEEHMFMVNTGDLHCYSVKAHDDIAKVTCLECWWEGERIQLEEKND